MMYDFPLVPGSNPGGPTKASKYAGILTLTLSGDLTPKSNLPTFGTAKYLNRELPATVTGSGCTSLKPEWGEDYPRTRVCRRTSADACSSNGSVRDQSEVDTGAAA